MPYGEFNEELALRASSNGQFNEELARRVVYDPNRQTSLISFGRFGIQIGRKTRKKSPNIQTDSVSSITPKVIANLGLMAASLTILAPVTSVYSYDRQVAGCEIVIPGHLQNGDRFTEWGLSAEIANAQGADPRFVERNINAVNGLASLSFRYLEAGWSIIDIPRQYCPKVEDTYPANTSHVIAPVLP
jgi:hypothetical protein